jgi:hypothetical protein
MDLSAKLKMISNSKKFAEIRRKPTNVEFDKPYPIMAAYLYSSVESIIVSLSLQTSEDAEEFRLAHIKLSRAQWRVFDDDDNVEINANPGKYKLIYRRKHSDCDYCYFLVIKT